MITNIHFPKPDFKINVIAAVLIILTIIVGTEYYGFAPFLLITAILTYSFIGPIYRKISEKKL